MSEVIMEDLTQIKKEYGHKRKTAIENAEAIVLEEPKVEEMDVVFLMDRFGYAKTIDTSAYERNKEAVHNENKYDLRLYGSWHDAQHQSNGHPVWKIP